MNKPNPKVSIGIPVFNGEKYLSTALDSILAQTFTNFELIISDNASTDNTGEICKSYQANDGRIRYYENKKNRGAAWNYNRVFQLASGEYFKWAAHDDFLEAEFLEKCLETFDRESQVVLVYPRSYFCDEEGRIEGTYQDGLDLRDPSPHVRFRNFLAKPGFCHAVFGLIKSGVLRRSGQIGNYPRSDRNLLGELCLAGQIAEIPEHLFYRRVHPHTSTKENVTEYELAVWFDPDKKGKIVFPRWRRLSEYINAIFRVEVGWLERIRCVMELSRFVFVPKRLHGLVDDLRILSLLTAKLKGHS